MKRRIIRRHLNPNTHATVKNIHIKRGLNNNMKLNRKTPLNPSQTTGGVRAALRHHIARESKEKLKAVPRKAMRQLNRTVDPHDHEEVHETLKSLELPKDSIRKTRNAYLNIKKSADRVQQVNRYIKDRRYRVETVSAYRRIKGNRVPSASAANGVNKIKTLSSKYVPKGKYASLGLKTGVKKAFSSSAAYLKFAAQQMVKQLIAAVAANPKAWLIGAAVGAVIFFLMMLTNSLGGTTTSSAGAFFMTDEENARQYKQAVERLNNDFQEKIRDLQNSSDYDDIRTEYMNEDGTVHVNWVDLFAVLAVHFEQDLEITDVQRAYMEEIYNEFNVIKTSKQTYTVRECDRDGCTIVKKKRLIIKIYSYDMEDVFDKIGFNDEQQEWARRLVTSGAIQEQFPDLAEELPGGVPDPGSGNLPPPEFEGDVSEARKKLIETALTLQGKVGYFWGGKSSPGWNNKWGTPVMVTAPGSEKTGTLQPYGLDCSGFIDWSFKSAGLGNAFSAGGTSYQWSKTYSIRESEMIPGDLIFKNIPGHGGINHIGIFIGRDGKGKPIYVHCQGGTGVIVNGYKGFKYPRRPIVFSGG